MTVVAYAIYRAARSLMTPEEIQIARALAARAEAGDHAARTDFEALVNRVLRDRKRQKPNGNKKS
jgi:hypothetical protein